MSAYSILRRIPYLTRILPCYFSVLNVPNDRMTHPWDGVFLGLAKTIYT